jgi:uncharacterized protein
MRWCLPLAAATLAACSPMAGEASPQQTSASAAARHPVSGLEVAPLRVITAAGARHDFKVEMARSGEEQQRGLMFRTAMGPDEGMLFPREPAEVRSFWMKNTVIPLDIIFIGSDRRILNIAANTVPYSLDSVPSAGPVIAVLELIGGRAAQLGIKPGDRVEW